MSPAERFYSIHGLVGFSINEHSGFVHGCFSRLATAYENFEVEELESPDIEISTGKFTPSNHNCRIVDEKFHVKSDYLYCGTDSYKFARWAVEFTGFESQKARIRVSPNLPAELVIQGDVIAPMILMQIAEKGASIVHGSGVSRDGRAIVLAGRSAAGKTTLALKLAERGYNFLGDNFVILRDGEVLAYLSPLGVFSYNLTPVLKEGLGGQRRLVLALKEALYRITGGYIKLFTSVNPREVLEDSVAKRADLSHIVLLFSGQEFRVSDMGRQDLIEHLVLNQMMDSPKFLEYGLAYSYEFPESTFARYWDTYKRNLRENIPLDVSIYRLEVPPRHDDRVLDWIENLIAT